MSQVMRACFILLGTSLFYLWPHSLRIISAKDVYVTKIGIFPFLDDTCYFISQFPVILP